jgi:type VI secretion system secreted protein VgrG
MTTRTFILHTPLGDDQTLRFMSLHGTEALSTVSEFDLQAWSTSADIEANDLLGKSMTVEIINQEGNSRYLDTIVTEFTYVGPESSATQHHIYRAKLSSWLWLSDKAADCRIYQKKSIPTIITEVLQDFGQPFQLKLLDQYPPLDYVVQYQETKLHFVKRLAEQAGIYFYARHELGRHTIYFTDGQHSPLEDYATIPFLTPNQRTLEGEEYITEWQVQTQVQSGRYATRSYNFKTPNSTLDQIQDVRKGHSNDGLEMYEWGGTYADRGDGGKLAEVRREQQQLHYQINSAASNVRGIAPGYTFTLSDHPRAATNTSYLIIGADYHFQENPDTTHANQGGTSWHIGFTAMPSQDRYWPPRLTHKVRVNGAQTAVVSGPAGQEIWTNEYGQVILTFPWDRYAQKDENDSKWIRVASSWAGSNWGESMVPRIGQEVVVEYLDGDPDQPIITSRVNNYNQMPNSFSNAGALPRNAAIAGLKSKELKGRSYNQLLMDDTSGEMRVQLESEHAKTQLNMGFLVHPRDGDAQPRGEGFELRTDAWGAIRAQKGILITTDGRTSAVGNALSREELIGCLKQALSIAKSLGESASDCNAGTNDLSSQQALSDSITNWGHGSNAEKGGGGGAPVFAANAAEGIALTTPKNALMYAGKNLDLVAEKSQQLSAGKTMHLHAANGINHFSYNGGVRSIAHQGKNQIQAQSGDIAIEADKSVKITASKDHVLVAAAEHVTLTSGGAYVKIAGGNIELHCPGNVTIKAGNYSMSGPASMNVTLPTFSGGESKS